MPNVSEGRRQAVIDRLASAVQRPGVRLLDLSADPDHNRSVLTLAGSAAALHESLFALFATALAEIDLRRHTGVHPRVGAVDVVPFVPLGATSMERAVVAARQLGRAVAARWSLPVFFYEEAASAPHRRSLAAVRRGGLSGLGTRLAGQGWLPDHGPRELHPTAGATVIGARFFLIAFNVVLRQAPLATAQAIARRLRESNGGMPAVRAIGVELPSRGRAQVSMNLLDFRRTPVQAVLTALAAEVEAAGDEVASAELIGLVPQAAVPDAAALAGLPAALTAPWRDPGRRLEPCLALP